MKIELRSDKIISDDLRHAINIHSLLNILNVIYNFISYIGEQHKMGKRLNSSLRICFDFIKGISSANEFEKMLLSLGELEILLKNELQGIISSHPEINEDDVFSMYYTNLDSLFKVLKIRMKELQIVIENPNKWCECDEEEVINSLGDFLSAVEKNSLGKYNIEYNMNSICPKSYNIRFNINSTQNEKLKMPMIFNDVIRDTIANSRKYSSPGSEIDARIIVNNQNLVYELTDNGIGIPNEELHLVADPRKRGSNVKHLKSFGGGLGLTKASMVTDYFSGKMWIESEENIGTKITIEIPQHKELKSIQPCYL